jgi:hypothetical protein
MHELDWDKYFYPLYGSTITIPEDTIVWRGYDVSYKPLAERPLFFGSRATATGYAEQENRTLGSFQTIRPLKVIDVRYLKILLKQLIDENKKKHLTKTDIDMIKSITVSYGLCSLKHQLELIKDVYKEHMGLFKGFEELEMYSSSILNKSGGFPLVEEQGVRIAETTIDTYTTGFIQSLFEDIFDGILSPRLFSPFHVEKDGSMSPELLLFNPIDSVKQVAHPSKLLSIPINGIILRSNYIYTTKNPDMQLVFYLRGMKGGTHDKNEKEVVKLYNKGVQIGKKWKQRNMDITKIEPITPQYKLNLFG